MRLEWETSDGVPLLRARGTDAAIAFTSRQGGVSDGSFASLNLGFATADDSARVSLPPRCERRRKLMWDRNSAAWAATLVLAGSEPLLPERKTPYEPSLLTDEDFAAYARHPLVEAHRIAGGHTLLDHNPDGVMAASRDFMLRHGYLPVG